MNDRADARSGFLYAPRYCEENIWHLAGREDLSEGRRLVVFISNELKRCPVWQQLAGHGPDDPVVWDYHVVLVICTASGPAVWDLDSRLPAGYPLALYLERSFPLADCLIDALQPIFRVLTAAAYLAEFGSDRSHMVGDNGQWAVPPPPWPPIGVHNTLHHYWNCTKSTPGQLCRSFRELLDCCGDLVRPRGHSSPPD